MKRALVVLLVASTAHANVWQHAIEKGQPDPQQDIYDSEMKSADDLAMQANAKGNSFKNVKRLVDLAVMSYRNAANAKPNEAEPWYRIGRVLYSFYFDCQDGISFSNASPLCFANDRRLLDRNRAKEIVEAWDKFEERAPLDPRLSIHINETDILFRRAILETKLADKANLAAAAKDYEKMIDRSDPGSDTLNENVWSNLAETYMMLDRLEDSIDMYQEAIRRGGSASTIYGLAVALDRDEHTAAAKDLIQSQGEATFVQFHQSFLKGDTFFVPAGEENYYFALAAEAFDHDDDAVLYWQRYITSGAHAEFQPRAKAHLAELNAKGKRRSLPKAPWDDLLEQ